MPLAAGDLRHRVTVQRNAGFATSSVGQPVADWQDDGGRWCRVEDLSAGMVWKASAAGTRVKTMVTLREPFDGVALKTRFRFEERGRTRLLGIVEVRRRPEADYVECFCVEVA